MARFEGPFPLVEVEAEEEWKQVFGPLMTEENAK
jgi:hypothetical protein